MNRISRFITPAILFSLCFSTIVPTKAEKASSITPVAIIVLPLMTAIGAYAGYAQSKRSPIEQIPLEPQKNTVIDKIKHFFKKHRTALYTIAGATGGLVLGSCCVAMVQPKIYLSNIKKEAEKKLEQTLNLKIEALNQQINDNLITRNQADIILRYFDELKFLPQWEIRTASTEAQINTITQEFEIALDKVLNDELEKIQRRQAREERKRNNNKTKKEERNERPQFSFDNFFEDFFNGKFEDTPYRNQTEELTKAATDLGLSYTELQKMNNAEAIDQLKAAYKKLAREWHPDKNQHRKAEAEIKFKEITNAYTQFQGKYNFK